MKINQVLFVFFFLFYTPYTFAQGSPGVGCDACQPLGDNILINGDFEMGDMNFNSDLTSDIMCGTNTYNIETGLNNNCINSSIPDHTIGDGGYMLLNVALIDDGTGIYTTDTTVWSQSPLLLDEQEYVFSFWIHNLSIYEDIPEPQLEVLINGTSIGTTTSINDDPISNGGWQKYCFNYFSSEEGIQTIEINQIYPAEEMFEVTSFALDDISMSPQYEDAIQCELIVEYVDGISQARKDSIRSRFDITLQDSCVCGNIDLWLINQFPMVVNGDTIVDIQKLKKSSKDTADIQDVDFNYRTRNHAAGYAKSTTTPISIDNSYSSPNSDDSCAIVVAVIDTGVDASHDRFTTTYPNSIWSFSTPCPVGANNGYNFSSEPNSNDANDDGLNGHGTHVAGIIAEQYHTNFSSDDWSLEIMPIKAQDEEGRGTLFKVICSTLFATDNGADVINMSFGYRGDSTAILYNAIERAEEMNQVLVVCSAGNDARNNDKYGHYPSNLSNNNLIAVAADTLGENNMNNYTPYSCFGVESVDIAVNGLVESSIPFGIDVIDGTNDGLGFLQGTSMAAPQIAAAAAIGKAYLNDATSIKNTILNSGNAMNINLDTISLTNRSFDILLYKQNLSNNQVNICELIDSNDNYFNPQNLVKISPNPVADILQIQYEGVGNIQSISLFDIQGKLISKPPLNNVSQIYVEKLPKGVYIIEVNLGKQQIRKKFIKM